LQRNNATFDRYGVLAVTSYVRLLISTHRARRTMKIFFAACIAAALIAIGGVAVLSGIQEPVSVAFTTSAVRI